MEVIGPQQKQFGEVVGAESRSSRNEASAGNERMHEYIQ